MQFNFMCSNYLLQNQSFLNNKNVAVSSILADVTSVNIKHVRHCYVSSGQAVASTAITSWVHEDGHTFFAIATAQGSILLIKIPPCASQGTIVMLYLIYIALEHVCVCCCVGVAELAVCVCVFEGGAVTEHELKSASMMQRLFTGLVPGRLR